MRQRNIKDLDGKMYALRRYMTDKYEGKEPVEVEIGCGKGKFLTTLASANPDKLYIGIEGQSNVLLRALEKAESEGLENIRYINGYVDNLSDIVSPGTVQVIYLNFSDPWPKARHYKRRLTYRDRLAGYMKALTPGGRIEIRTDNKELFRFTLGEAEALKLAVAEVCENLHGEKEVSVTTEYEDRFILEGKPIYFICIRN